MDDYDTAVSDAQALLDARSALEAAREALERSSDTCSVSDRVYTLVTQAIDIITAAFGERY
jgi:hypothetical protein